MALHLRLEEVQRRGFGVPRMLTTKEKSKLPKGWRVVVEAGLETVLLGT